MYRSLHPPLDIPATPLAEFVLARAAARGQRPALVCAVTGRSVSYAALPELVNRTAVGLAALGIAKGDVCAIFAANSPEYVIAVLAIARLGAVVTTASSAYTKDDLAKQLRDSGARLLFTSQLFAPIWTQAIAGTADGCERQSGRAHRLPPAIEQRDRLCPRPRRPARRAQPCL